MTTNQKISLVINMAIMLVVLVVTTACIVRVGYTVGWWGPWNWNVGLK